MKNIGHITPNWNINDFKSLEFKLDPDPYIKEEYTRSGHNIEALKIYNCFEPNINFSISNILENFNFLSNISCAVNLFRPGQYIPLHSDRYERYVRLHNLPNADSVVRIILMLEDNSPGQFLQVKNKVMSEWSSGDWFAWNSYDEHAFYNLSKSDRYALQITGIYKI